MTERYWVSWYANQFPVGDLDALAFPCWQEVGSVQTPSTEEPMRFYGLFDLEETDKFDTIPEMIQQHFPNFHWRISISKPLNWQPNPERFAPVHLEPTE